VCPAANRDLAIGIAGKSCQAWCAIPDDLSLLNAPVLTKGMHQVHQTDERVIQGDIGVGSHQHTLSLQEREKNDGRKCDRFASPRRANQVEQLTAQGACNRLVLCIVGDKGANASRNMCLPIDGFHEAKEFR
jgi:hypothetical protein